MEQLKKRKGQSTGVITEFTVIANVMPGHEKAIRAAIKAPQSRGQTFKQEAIEQIGTLHEARFVLFDDDRRLEFASSFDGTWDKYIEDFASTVVGQIFESVFLHCVGWPGYQHLDAAKEWFMANTIEALDYSCVYPNSSVKEILKALAVQQAFQQVLDNPEAEQALQHPALQPLLDQAAS